VGIVGHELSLSCFFPESGEEGRLQLETSVEPATLRLDHRLPGSAPFSGRHDQRAQGQDLKGSPAASAQATARHLDVVLWPLRRVAVMACTLWALRARMHRVTMMVMMMCVTKSKDIALTTTVSGVAVLTSTLVAAAITTACRVWDSPSPSLQATELNISSL